MPSHDPREVCANQSGKLVRSVQNPSGTVMVQLDPRKKVCDLPPGSKLSYTVDEAAQALGLSVATIWAMLKAGEITATSCADGRLFLARSWIGCLATHRLRGLPSYVPLLISKIVWRARTLGPRLASGSQARTLRSLNRQARFDNSSARSRTQPAFSARYLPPHFRLRQTDDPS